MEEEKLTGQPIQQREWGSHSAGMWNPWEAGVPWISINSQSDTDKKEEKRRQVGFRLVKWAENNEWDWHTPTQVTSFEGSTPSAWNPS